MPNIKSAIKRMRSDAKKAERNSAAISELKTLTQKLQALAAEPAKANELAKQVFSRYDRAVSRGKVPKGRADRKKARIAQFLKKLTQSQ